jgi:hypothetical protein
LDVFFVRFSINLSFSLSFSLSNLNSFGKFYGFYAFSSINYEDELSFLDGKICCSTFILILILLVFYQIATILIRSLKMLFLRNAFRF